MQSCGKDLTLFIKERVPTSVEEMAQFADQFREARGGSNVNWINRPRRPESNYNAQPPPPHKFHQQSTNTSRGGLSSSIPRGGIVKPKSDKRCFLCNRFGHFANECIERQKAFAVETDMTAGVESPHMELIVQQVSDKLFTTTQG